MTKTAKTTFALFFGNRWVFPASLQSSARAEVSEALKRLGHEVLMLPESATQYGAVESPRDGEIYARFLRENRGRFSGVIVCLPNFGDETGAVAALQDAGVPILIQAYPDELDRMAPALRRDAFCGKFSIMDVFTQYGVPFTAMKPHVVHPASDAFGANIEYFDRLCRVHAAMKRMVVGSIGARTTAFKTVRIDELALQKHGITVETLDLSNILGRMKSIMADGDDFRAKADRLQSYASFTAVPAKPFENLVRLGVAIDGVIEEFGLDAVAIRCWLEIQQQAGISPCVILSELNDRGFAAACEVDIGSAITMHALRAASGSVAACLDWNNNYGNELDKCILFHCGPVPQTMMRNRGQVVDHTILANAIGPGCSYGCNVGRIAPAPFTFGNVLTRDGRLECYLGEGHFTQDEIPDDFFGCAGVAHIPNLQSTLQTIGCLGHRHHVAVSLGHVAAPVHEAMTKYLGYQVARV